MTEAKKRKASIVEVKRFFKEHLGEQFILEQCLLGKVAFDPERTPVSIKSWGVLMRKPNGGFSDLRFCTGDSAMVEEKGGEITVIEIYGEDGDLAVRYLRKDKG